MFLGTATQATDTSRYCTLRGDKPHKPLVPSIAPLAMVETGGCEMILRFANLLKGRSHLRRGQY